VEIVDEHFRAIVFAPRDRTRALNIALARDLSRLGGQARLIGPEEADQGWWTTPVVTASLAPLIEIVPVQCAAMRLAEWRGFTPGEFRVATQVTSSESGF
jgi:fructoselysine-6-P-deglycase FrlB-like protein